MNREEFLSKQAESERRIKRRVVPMGVIYAIRLASVFGGVILMALLCIFFTTDARNPVLLALGICGILFAASFPAERDSRMNFAKLALKCPSCQDFLVFIEGRKTAATGICPRCAARIFDP